MEKVVVFLSLLGVLISVIRSRMPEEFMEVKSILDLTVYIIFFAAAVLTFIYAVTA